MDLKLNLDKLNGESVWPRWKRQIDLYLRNKKVHGVVFKMEVSPKEPDAETAQEKAARLKKVDEFNEKDVSTAHSRLKSG